MPKAILSDEFLYQLAPRSYILGKIFSPKRKVVQAERSMSNDY